MSSPVWRPGEDPALPAAVVRRGGLLVIPTESSYGLAVDPLDPRAVAAIAAVKARPGAKPLPVVVAGPGQLARLGVDWTPELTGGLDALWPAALSLLLPCAAEVPAAAGTGKLAVRVPEHAALRKLLEDIGMGLTATSANAAGAPPILDPKGLDELLAGSDSLIVDGGTLPGGSPSTLVDVSGRTARVLREGRVSIAELARAAPDLEFSAASVEIPVEETR